MNNFSASDNRAKNSDQILASRNNRCPYIRMLLFDTNTRMMKKRPLWDFWFTIKWKTVFAEWMRTEKREFVSVKRKTTYTAFRVRKWWWREGDRRSSRKIRFQISLWCIGVIFVIFFQKEFLVLWFIPFPPKQTLKEISGTDGHANLERYGVGVRRQETDLCDFRRKRNDSYRAWYGKMLRLNCPSGIWL